MTEQQELGAQVLSDDSADCNDSAAQTSTSARKETKLPSCEPTHLRDDVTAVLQQVRRERQRPLFVLIAGAIDDGTFEKVYEWRKELKAAGEEDNLDILINSPGGDLNACYRIARLFARSTDSWEALVSDYAASGATLICLGSNNIVMSDAAYLSPLDPQVISKRQGKFFAIERQSPLEAFQAVKYLREFTTTVLDAHMTFLTQRLVSPKTALDTAAMLAVKCVEPIIGKIEPYDLGAFALDADLESV